MRRGPTSSSLGYSILATAVAAGIVHAGTIAMPPPGPARVANADAVIVGKVEALEPQDMKVGTTNYRIAVVRITQGLRGTKDEKTVRVGFIPTPPQPKGGPIVVTSGPREVQFQVGQEGLLLLVKKGKENFYVLPGPVGYYVGSEKNPSFEKEVQGIKGFAKAIEDPQKALKSNDADEQLVAASLLIDKYRSLRGPGKVKLEPIDAEESKRILQVLADADWKAQLNFSTFRPNAAGLFQQLGVAAKDGFMPPPGGNYQEAAHRWVRENMEKYRIQRLVVESGK